MAVRGPSGSDLGPPRPAGGDTRASASRAGSQPSGGAVRGTEPASAQDAPARAAPVVVSSSVQASSAMRGSLDEAVRGRISTLRAQIRDGTYKVDREKLAERIVDEELARAERT